MLYKQTDRIVVLTINRPERMNSVNLELMERLEKAWIRFRDDESAWVCIVSDLVQIDG